MNIAKSHRGPVRQFSGGPVAMAKSENDHEPRPEPWKKKVDDLLARRKVNRKRPAK